MQTSIQKMISKNKIFLRNHLLLYIGLFISFNSFALRASNEDIYGNAAGGSDIFGYFGLAIIGVLMVWGFIKNKGFRNGLLIYAGFLGGILLIFELFGKDVGIAACIIAVVFLWIYDRSISNKKD